MERWKLSLSLCVSLKKKKKVLDGTCLQRNCLSQCLILFKNTSLKPQGSEACYPVEGGSLCCTIVT